MHAKSCPALCNLLDCSLPGSSVRGISKTRILEWITFSSPGNIPDPGIEPASPVTPALEIHWTTWKALCVMYQFSSVTQLCPILWDPMECSMPCFPVLHQLLEIAQTYVHQVSDAIQPSHPLLSPSPTVYHYYIDEKCLIDYYNYLWKQMQLNFFLTSSV